MLTVLIVDDDEEVRRKAMHFLASPEIKLASAANGRIGLEQAALLKPDIVICDVDMPEINGFDVLAALKADETLASAQVMMLTGQGSRNSMRLGMSLGADDYLTKPFTEQELVDAVEGLIKRRGRLEVIKDHARGEEDNVNSRFLDDLGKVESTVLAPAGAPPKTVQVLQDAAVLFADIRGFTSMAEKLSAQDVARLLAAYFERICEPLLTHGGQYLRLMGDGVMAVFTPDPSHPKNASRRALLAATEMEQVVRSFAGWVKTSFAHAVLPPFQVGFGLHRGEVTIASAATPGRLPTPTGDTVTVASRLETASRELGWTIVASTTVLQQAGPYARTGAMASVRVRGRTQPVEVREVLGVAGHQHAESQITVFEKTFPLGTTAPAGSTSLPVSPPAGPDAVAAMHTRLGAEAAGRLRIDAREHAELAAKAVKDALGEKLAALRRTDFVAEDSTLRLAGFRILRRLGAGGMSVIYLARRESDSALVVLKVMPLDPTAQDMTARFMREFALLSQLSHPHIIRIFNQGFNEDSAYIAMEYFENGDLRSRMNGPLPPATATRIIEQVASALEVVHGLGIVHRDLKPENLMVRADTDVVLADFGIAKVTGAALARQPELTIVGDLMGSPSYMSPEQIGGEAVTHRSDFYSLGVMLYELLVGERPYKGFSLVELLSLHARAPLPVLPQGLHTLQPVLNRLMAKRPDDRPESATALLQELRAVSRKSY